MARDESRQKQYILVNTKVLITISHFTLLMVNHIPTKSITVGMYTIDSATLATSQ